MFMWPNARISVMGGEQAGTVLSTVKKAQLVKQGHEVWPLDTIDVCELIIFLLLIDLQKGRNGCPSIIKTSFATDPILAHSSK